MHKNIYNNNKKAYAASFQIRSSIKKFKGDFVAKGVDRFLFKNKIINFKLNISSLI